MNFKRLNDITGWMVFAIAAVVYFLTTEPTGSLWDCGEFISAADKLQVVHPPGAPLFLMVGRMFAYVGSLFSSNPENIAFAVNFLSGICTSFLVLFIFWSTTILAKMALVGRGGQLEKSGDILAVLASGVVAGLSTTFATSVWFSAVEGEVYAMSSFFTGIVSWATLRWYDSEDTVYNDRWLVFIAYLMGLSSTVHLLGLLTIPVITLFYYLKKNESHTPSGIFWALLKGVGLLFVFNFWAIPELPTYAANFDYFANSMGLPIGYGMVAFTVLLAILNGYWIYSAHKNVNNPGFAKKQLLIAIITPLVLYLVLNITDMQISISGLGKIILLCGAGLASMVNLGPRVGKVNYEASIITAVSLLGFSLYAMVVIRANANTPINMNNPSDPYSLVSYLKREQYGDRPLLRGPHFDAEPIEYKDKGDVYRPVNGKYEVVDKKQEPEYDPEDMMLFPRLGHSDRKEQYRAFLDLQCSRDPQTGKAYCPTPTGLDNLKFLFQYQLGWMYFRYFYWNFVGRQNAEQGMMMSDPTQGNWLSGINAIDNNRLYDQSIMPKDMKEDPGRNTYYFLPLIFGLLGMFWHFSKRGKEAGAVMLMFIMTGLAIILYLNQPPMEPRERDYSMVGSFFVFCIWIGLGVLGLRDFLFNRVLGNMPASGISALLALSAPLIMGFQNWDDHSRAGHYGARDYANNFLNSVEKNAIIFTYGDNDTYPLWYAQEVEGIRRDVRVVNFSLLAVDWYINQLRRKVNESDAIKMVIPEEQMIGELRNFLPIIPSNTPMNAYDALKHMASNKRHSSGAASSVPTKNTFIPVDREKAKSWGLPDSLIVDTMNISFAGMPYLRKDDIALYDIIVSNMWDRPVYFAVTCRPEKFFTTKESRGITPYLQLEGLALRVVPTLSKADERLGVAGYGRVEPDKMYNHIMNEWRWGNFDKKKTFIDRSYMPSIQTMQFSFMRLGEELIKKDDKGRAKQLMERYFQSFPHYNFPLPKNNGLPMLDILVKAGGYESAKPRIEEFAQYVTDHMTFFSKLDGFNEYKAYEAAYLSRNPNAANAAENKLFETPMYWFKEDAQRYSSYMVGLQKMVQEAGDKDFAEKLNIMFAPFVGEMKITN